MELLFRRDSIIASKGEIVWPKHSAEKIIRFFF